MSEMRILFNPSCSKCRGAKELLDGKSCEVTYVRYLEDHPSRADLEDIVRKLDLPSPRGMMRTGEAIYRELALETASDDQLYDAMTKHPILIERPIAIRGDRAIIGRPPEKILELLGGDS